MKNVKPMVGLKWKSTNGKVNDKWIDVEIVSYGSGIVRFKNNDGIEGSRWLENFYSAWCFVPQTDLEWLAVNRLDFSPHPQGYTSAIKFANQFIYQPDGTSGSHTLVGIQNKRYELGLDERPTELNEIENTHKTIYIPPQYINCLCTLTPLKKETKMIDLSTAKVGDEFVLNNGAIVSFFARTKMNSICELKSGHAMLYHHNGVFDESVESDDYKYNWNIAKKHDPRHWLKDLPDAGLFIDIIKWLSCDEDGRWWSSFDEPKLLSRGFATKSSEVNIIKMPTLTGDEWKQSKISITELREWQESNK